jgi:hypothetical protein
VSAFRDIKEDEATAYVWKTIRTDANDVEIFTNFRIDCRCGTTLLYKDYIDFPMRCTCDKVYRVRYVPEILDETNNV